MSNKKVESIQLPKSYMLDSLLLANAVGRLLEQSALMDEESKALIEYYIPEYVVSALNNIKAVSGEKIASKNKRAAYMAYRTEKDASRRERLRQEYLDIADINVNWRSAEEEKY